MSEYAATSPSGASLLNQKLGKWHLLRQLGEGGMSIVYLGYHPLLERKGAVKVMRPEMLQNKDVLERFRREALATNKLQHPNIIQVYDFEEAPQVGYYMVLEYLEGQEMGEIAPQFPMPIDWILGVFEQVCAGLAATHKAGIIHRDLKPSNIFLLPHQPHPRAKILDFGIAKQQKVDHQLTRTGTIMGTPAYLAPEQMISQKDLPNAQSADIYAIGVILYQVLTGKLPIERENLLEFLYAIASEEPAKIGHFRPELKGSLLEKLVARILLKDPTARPQTMEDLWAELEKAGKRFQDPLQGTKSIPPIRIPEPFPLPSSAELLTPPPISLAQPLPTPSPAFQPPPSTPKATPTPRQALPTGFLEEPLERASTMAFEDTSTNDLRPKADAAQRDISTHTPQSPFASPSPHTPPSLQEDETTASPSHAAHEHDTQRIDLPQKRRRQTVFLGFAVLVLVVSGWFGWGRFHPAVTSTQTPVVSHPITPPPPRRSFLDGLLAEAGDAFRQKNYQKAVALWKRALDDKRLDPKQQGKLYRGIGLAMVRDNKNDAAMRYYRLYLQAPDSEEAEDAKERARVREEVLPQMERDFKNRMAEAERLMIQLKRHARAKKLAAMKETYAQIQAILPTTPSVHAQVAQQLAPLLPYHALTLYDHISDKMTLTPKEFERFKAHAKTLRESLEKRENALAKVFQKAFAMLPKSKKHQAAQAMLLREFRKAPILGFQHPKLAAHLDELIHKSPKIADALLREWHTQQSKIEKNGALAWKEQAPNPYTDSAQLQQRRGQLSQLSKLLALRQQMREALHKLSANDSIALYSSFRKQWNRAEADPFKDRPRFFPRLNAYTTLPDAIDVMWKSHKQLLRNRDEGAFRTFAQEAARLRGLLQQHASFLAVLYSPALLKHWRNEIHRLEKICKQGQELLHTGGVLLQKQRWLQAEERFTAFQKLFPQYIRIDWLNKQIRTCQCARGVTWVSCDDIQIKKP
ncbi:protein kinase [Myxococcota bacterium]|nr:protein kinase [Myxococcota bacterium]